MIKLIYATSYIFTRSILDQMSASPLLSRNLFVSFSFFSLFKFNAPKTIDDPIVPGFIYLYTSIVCIYVFIFWQMHYVYFD